MKKKKIKPEDLYIKAESLKGFSSSKVETTRNTCQNIPPPHNCDTTFTDQSFNTCTSVPPENCNQSLLLCPSFDCKTHGCIQTESDYEVCCPLSNNDNCGTTICQVYPSIDVCPATDQCATDPLKGCEEQTIICGTNDNQCVLTVTNGCEETEWNCPSIGIGCVPDLD